MAQARKCRYCKTELNGGASTCPACGESDQSGAYGLAAMVVIASGIAVLVLIVLEACRLA